MNNRFIGFMNLCLLIGINLIGSRSWMGNLLRTGIALVAACILFVLAAPTTVNAQQQFIEVFKQTDFPELSQTGQSMAMDGNTLIVTSRKDDEIAEDAGAVYVYAYDDAGTPSPLDDTWTQEAKLFASDAKAFDRFGMGVAIQGDSFVVGAPYNYELGNGAAYVFERDINGNWVETQKLTAPDGQIDIYGDLFGSAAGLSGDTLVIGALTDDEAGLGAGALFVYRLINGVWTYEAKLIGSTITEFDNFGEQEGGSLKVRGDLIVAGASRFRSPERTGSVYVFARDPVTEDWVETQEIHASDSGTGNHFGTSLTLAADHLAIGALGYLDQTGGATYIYGLDDNGTPSNLLDDQWIEIQKLRPNDVEHNDNFGESVDFNLDGTLAVGSAYGDIGGSTQNRGSIYIFSYDDGGTPLNPLDDSWAFDDEISHSNPESGRFASPVIFNQGNLITADNVVSNRAGAIYVFAEIATTDFNYSATDIPVTILNPSGRWGNSKTVVSSMTVDTDMPIIDLNIRLDIDHEFINDVGAELVHRDSNGNELGRVELFFRPLGGGNTGIENGLFDDSASIPLRDAPAPFNGEYLPIDSLSIFNGQSALGTWELEVTDYAKRNGGTLLSWSIEGVGISTPGINVSPTTGLSTSEDGGQDTFDVSLATQPTDNVTIGISSSNNGEGTTNVTSLTFTPGNFDIPQSVIVTGIDDGSEDGDVAYTIVTDSADSLDPNYDMLNADDVQVTNLDNDPPTGGGTEVYSSTDTPTNIPDQGMADSTIVVNDDYQILDLTVTLAISHPRPSDLDVYLIGPNSDIVQLSNFSGDNVVTDFDGVSTDGSWTIEVYDTRKKKTGTINGWSITVDY